MRRGFTLIELLAVIVILAVIALIAYPTITGIVENSKKNSALRSIEGYVEAANNATVIYDVDNSKGINVTVDKHIFTSDVDTLDFSKIKVKGTIPTYSYIDFNTKTKAVKEGHFCISGYSVIYENNQAKISDTNYCTDNQELPVEVSLGTEWVFDYNGVDGNSPSVQSFEVPKNGSYKLEVWGAQGGTAYTQYSTGGSGGYSVGTIDLTTNDILYVAVGGEGGVNNNSKTYGAQGGFNGGGSTGWHTAPEYGEMWTAGGGGATHIALNSNRGELKNYVDNKDEVLIVAGGGGGGSYHNNLTYHSHGNGGCGGGSAGCNGTTYGNYTVGGGGTSNAPGSSTANVGGFGYGGYSSGGSASGNSYSSGGGAGWYGGGCGVYSGAGGGSGYIGGVIDGYTIAGNASMPTHDGASTMTGNTGNGYAKITLISY